LVYLSSNIHNRDDTPSEAKLMGQKIGPNWADEVRGLQKLLCSQAGLKKQQIVLVQVLFTSSSYIYILLTQF